ncbi:MAG: argininosuccinate lyase [Candidatus Hydrogenedentota bacterium]
MKNRLWGGRFKKEQNPLFMKFQSSLNFDLRLYSYDIIGSKAYASELCKKGVLSEKECKTIIKALDEIKQELDRGKHKNRELEDIHTLIEVLLIEKIGETAKKIHTGRSRNDQVMVDIKLYLLDEMINLKQNICSLIKTLVAKSKKYLSLPFPSYTHLQPAQPVLFSHYLLYIANTMLRDGLRVKRCFLELSSCPLGTGAISGNAFSINRERLAKSLNFLSVTQNSIDTVTNRDDLLDVLYAIAVIGVHLSRVAEDLIIFSSKEFDIVEIKEEFKTGSSLMPQKRNPDLLELIRGKSARFISNLNRLMIVLKALPSGYQKDLQEDKEALFDSIDQIKIILNLFTQLIQGLKINEKRAREILEKGQMTATDLADYFVLKGIPFREAHRRSGEIIQKLEENDLDISTVDIKILKKIDSVIEDDVEKFIRIEGSINRRNVTGGTSIQAVKKTIRYLEKQLNKF